MTELPLGNPILSLSRKMPEQGWHGRMAATAVHGAIRHELWRAFRDQPLDGLVVFPARLKVAGAQTPTSIPRRWLATSLLSLLRLPQLPQTIDLAGIQLE